MNLLRLGWAAVVVVAVVSCSTDDERERLGELMDADGPTEAAAEAVLPEAAPAAVGAGPSGYTLILTDILTGELGSAVAPADLMAIERTTQATLETVRIGDEGMWRNPETGAHGSIAPRRTWQKASGQYCREFTQTLIVGTASQQATGSACRAPDGTWAIEEG